MREIVLPDEIRVALENGATLFVSKSGGKDSQAMLNALVAAHRAHGWTGELKAIHAHLGRMEWPQSLPHCQATCDALGVELIVVSRPQGDLLQEMQDRMVKLLPDSKNRYCTSHHKQQQIDKALRQHTLVISAEGIRADESPARRKRPAYERREQICTRTRTAYTWRPLLDWSEEDVWEACGTTLAELEHWRASWKAGRHTEALAGWVGHPAYVMGNKRVSCALCVLASRGDIINGARHNPKLLESLIQMEVESGYSFRQDLALRDLILDAPPDASQPVVLQLPLL